MGSPGEELREPADEEVRSAAAEGVRTPEITLPYLDLIRASFGRHSVGHIKAHVGAEALQASRAMSARAFASGDHVVFGGTPDLRTAAHEAAHVVQQRAGVHLAGGIGREGDVYERHADTVADAVVAGRSAEGLLEPFVAPPAGSPFSPGVVQCLAVVRQKNGEWRNGRKNENLTKLPDLNDLENYKNTQVYVETDELGPQDRERLLEIIAKSGQSSYARELRNALGAGIYVPAEQILSDQKIVASEIKRLVNEGVSLSGIDGSIQYFQGLLDRTRQNRGKVILDAGQADGIYNIQNDLFADEALLMKVLGSLETIREKNKESDQDAKVLIDLDPSKFSLGFLNRKARRFRERTAYGQLPLGSQWKDEGLDERTQDIRASSKIAVLSANNLQKLIEEVELDEASRNLYERLVNLPFTIKHATPAWNAIRNSGILSSLVNLDLWGSKQKASGMSSKHNTGYKGDADFAFFRFDVGDSPMETRYGPTTIVADASILAAQGGWVSLHDQLVPLDRESMRQLRAPVTGAVVRTSQHDPEHLGTGKQTEWTNRYPANPEGAQGHRVSFLDEVFYGPDIVRGIALSVIRELNRIGGVYRAQALQLTRQEDLRSLLSSLFRVEAKLPSSFKLSEANIVQVHNPMGDGRYLRSGIMHPEGMAAGAAYDAAKRHMTTINSVLEGIARPGSLERRAREIAKLLSFLKDHFKLREQAASLTKEFLDKAEQEAKEQPSEENKERRLIAARELESRTKDLQDTESMMKEWSDKSSALENEIANKRQRKKELELKLALAKMQEREMSSNNDEWAGDDEYLPPEEARELARLRSEVP